MTNPWLKKNPYMSLWLSGAHRVANTAGGKISAEAKRQTTAAVSQAGSDMLRIWTDALLSGSGTGGKTTRRKKR